MISEKDQIDRITDISETLLIPLYARARETQSKHPLLDDKKAVQITKKLNIIFASSDSPLHRRLMKGKIRRTANEKLTVFLSVRSRRFDRYCEEFLCRCPDGVIVELGCGLSSRFSRIDNGHVHWYDLDLPEVIAIRRGFFEETERYHMIASSVLDFQWLEQLALTQNGILFIAEGLLMYLREEEVKSLVLQLQHRFLGCELVCEVVNNFVINALQKKRWQRKFQRDHHLGSEVTMQFGICDGAVMESWGQGIRFKDEWTIFDDHEKKLGWMNLFSFSKRLRKAQWIVHYQLQ
ncbi:MAG: class I SAM-dependent methyltransferase [Candidatus Thermoplasmatota archaeon]|nr:class I SAM-dependent methyltransferase [Candidatus Thermoplasmatota archaeon]